jgi:hypothetical protein
MRRMLPKSKSPDLLQIGYVTKAMIISNLFAVKSDSHCRQQKGRLVLSFYLENIYSLLWKEACHEGTADVQRPAARSHAQFIKQRKSRLPTEGVLGRLEIASKRRRCRFVVACLTPLAYMPLVWHSETTNVTELNLKKALSAIKKGIK